MGTTVEKLTKVLETKEAIRTAINNKGGTLTESDTFSSYSTAIDNIQTGGGENPLQYIIDNQGGDGVPSCRYLFYNYQGTSLDSVLKGLYTSNVKNFQFMFSSCSNLISISQLDTSSATDMGYMFQDCERLTTIPQLDTSSVKNMNNMFQNCSKLTSIPQLDTSSLKTMNNMFQNCSKLTSIPQLDTSNVTDMGYMFYNCSSLTTIPLLDTSNVTSMQSMFNSNESLTTIPSLNASNVTEMIRMFANCYKLSSIGMYGFTRTIDISSTALNHDALVAFLNQAGTAYNSSQKITMGSKKLALLSDEEKAIATNKGWTLA